MSRKTKPGIDYFSHDVDTTSDLKIKILIAKYGLLGYAVYIRLLEEVYRGQGYYLQISEDFNILFADDCNLDLNVYIETLNVCIEKDLFNKKLYEKYLILTSKRIQKNYFAGTERRKGVEFIKEYLIENPEDFYNLEKVDVIILDLIVDIKPLNDSASTQSKVKERKKKGKESIIPKPESVTDQTWNDWNEHRESKKAKVTQTVINGFIKQAEKAGFTLESAFKESIDRNWVGFKAEWVNKGNQSHNMSI